MDRTNAITMASDTGGEIHRIWPLALVGSYAMTIGSFAALGTCLSMQIVQYFAAYHAYSFISCIKMLYLIGPDELVNQGYANFQNLVWMTMVHIILSHAVFF